MNRRPGNGAASAFTIGRPPSGSAGKNLSTRSPSSIAAWISVAVATPGKTGTPTSRQCRTTVGLKPGETMNRAPASTARSTCSGVSTVPAPTNMSGVRAISRSASLAAGVRNVTSAQRRPPLASAVPRGSAAATSLMTTTGTSRVASMVAVTSSDGLTVGSCLLGCLASRISVPFSRMFSSVTIMLSAHTSNAWWRSEETPPPTGVAWRAYRYEQREPRERFGRVAGSLPRGAAAM